MIQRIVSRFGLRAVVGLVLAVLLLAAASLILAIGYRNQVTDLKHTIYLRCLQRSAYDAALHDSAKADLVEQRALIQIVTARNRPGDERLVAVFEAKASKDRQLVARGVIGNCQVLR